MAYIGEFRLDPIEMLLIFGFVFVTHYLIVWIMRSKYIKKTKQEQKNFREQVYNGRLSSYG